MEGEIEADISKILFELSAAPPIKCKNPIPFSMLQMFVNSTFYSWDGDPLELMGTLGNADKMLAKAKANDFKQKYSGERVIHEIGPGNFNFAKTFVDEVGRDLEYRCHDFSDSAYSFSKEGLKPYSDVISFNKRNIKHFADEVKDDPMHLVMVEILDDTFTDFYTKQDGTEYMLFVQPQIRGDAVFPSRVKRGKMLEDEGDSSLATQKMMKGPGLERDYNAKEIIQLLDENNWEELRKVFPTFLKFLKYESREFVPVPLEQLPKLSWVGMPDGFNDCREKVMGYFRKQLDDIENAQVLHIPIDGINLLWKLKDRKKVHVDMFDYGYADPSERVGYMSTYNGQITAPVNFGLLKYAAEQMGYDVLLEKNRDFIKRNTGKDTIPLGYVQKAISHWGWDMDKVKEVFSRTFEKAVKMLDPDADCSKENIISYRIPREEFEKFMKVAIDRGAVPEGYKLSEGSYHMAVSKG